jgi:hypothetical protein
MKHAAREKVARAIYLRNHGGSGYGFEESKPAYGGNPQGF